MIAVIMAGGCGTRFWPFSRVNLPKQFLPIIDQKTMLQLTIDRLNDLIPPENIYVVTTRQYQGIVREQLPQIKPSNLIIEPASRETAPGIGLAVLTISRFDPSAVIAVLPSDHFVNDLPSFQCDLKTGASIAEENDLIVTLGVKPTRPETAYGYIRINRESASPLPGYAVAGFVEKPMLDLALEYYASGSYLWNSGIFIFKAQIMLDEISQHLPALYESLQRLAKNCSSPMSSYDLEAEYYSIEPISIDYGVMEKTNRAWVIPASFTWDDLGSWQSLSRVFPANTDGNMVRGAFAGKDTRNCVIVSQKPLIATIGVEELIIVATPDAVLVCPRHRDQEVKELLRQIESTDGLPL